MQGTGPITRVVKPANSQSHDTQLLKGLLNLVLLRLIAVNETYGYEIVTQVHALGLGDVNDGTIYPALNRLERDGAIVAELRRSSSGPARKYYRITPHGSQVADEIATSWSNMSQVIQRLLELSPQESVKKAV